MCYDNGDMVMSEKQDPENREETPTSNRPASTGRRDNGFRGQAAENPRLSSYVLPRAGEPWRQVGVSSRVFRISLFEKISDLETPIYRAPLYM